MSGPGSAPVGAADRSTPGSFVRWLAAITVLGLGVRVLVVALASRDLPFDDGVWYLGQAHIIAAGHGYLSPAQFIFHSRSFATAEHPPLYPALLALMVWLGHGSVLALQMTSAVVGSLGVAVIGLLGRRVAGPRVGLVAAGLCAVAPNIWQYNALLLSESILALTSACTCWRCTGSGTARARVRGLRRPRARASRATTAPSCCCSGCS